MRKEFVTERPFQKVFLPFASPVRFCCTGSITIVLRDRAASAHRHIGNLATETLPRNGGVRGCRAVKQGPSFRDEN
eukprot:scaffold117914_cov36-Tisochrysis_lutea.AAC.7